MLQIITEKFYRPGERCETLHRAVFYTNYRMFRADRLETPIGILVPATGIEGLGALTCKVLEKIEKHPDGEKPGVMIPTGGTSLLNDLAAVTAFALDITCTPDPDLTRRSLATDRPSLGVQASASRLSAGCREAGNMQPQERHSKGAGPTATPRPVKRSAAGASA